MNEHKDMGAAAQSEEASLADFERTEALPLAGEAAGESTVELPPAELPAESSAVEPTIEMTAAEPAAEPADTVAMPEIHIEPSDTEVLPTVADSADTTAVLPQQDSADYTQADHTQTAALPDLSASEASETSETSEEEQTTVSPASGTDQDTPAAVPTPEAQSVPLYSTAQSQSGPYVQVPYMQFEQPVVHKTGPSAATIALGVCMLVIGLIGAIIAFYGVSLPLTLLAWISDDPRVLFAVGCAGIGGLLILVAIIWSIAKVVRNSRNKPTDDQA